MRENGRQPADGVGQIQIEQGAMGGKKGVNVHDTHAAHAHDGDEHGHHRVSHAAHAAHQHFHDPAQEIDGADDAHAFQPHPDHFVRFGVNGHQETSRKVYTQPDDKPQQGDDEQAVEKSDVDVFPFVRAVILPRKGEARLRDGVHRRIDKPFDVGGFGVGGDGDVSERIDGRLDDDVGQGEDAPLHARGQTDANDVAEGVLIDAQFSQIHVTVPFQAAQVREHEGRGDQLCDDRPQRHARHVHAADDDEEDVQPYVGHARRAQKKEGRARIAARAAEAGTRPPALRTSLRPACRLPSRSKTKATKEPSAPL